MIWRVECYCVFPETQVIYYTYTTMMYVYLICTWTVAELHGHDHVADCGRRRTMLVLEKGASWYRCFVIDAYAYKSIHEGGRFNRHYL